jgi:hypothetical protein
MTNTQDYYNSELVTGVKTFIVETPETQVIDYKKSMIILQPCPQILDDGGSYWE